MGSGLGLGDEGLGGGGPGGDIVGPASSTDNAIARYDGITGRLLQDSNVLIDNSDNVTMPASATLGTDGTIETFALAEKASIELDSALGADGDYTGITITGLGGATIAFGQMVYFDATTSEWHLTDSNNEATSGNLLVGICVLASTDGNPITVLLQGTIRADAAFPALTISAPVFIGETAGAIQLTAPTATDDVVRIVGHAITADSIYFNPSPNWMTVV